MSARRTLPRWLAIVGFIGSMALSQMWIGEAAELSLDARALDTSAICRHVRLADDGQALELERGELFEDDGPAAGYSYRPNEELLAADIEIKKLLVIADPQANGATLLVGPGGNLQASINGRSQSLGAPQQAGGYWQAYAISPGDLRPGQNEIVLSGMGKVWIARDDEFPLGAARGAVLPNRSLKSADGGQTWTDVRLGTAGDLDGEYYVRLFLDHYRSRGSLTLPVLDAGNLDGRPVPDAVGPIGPIRIGVQTDVEAAGRIAVRARSGASPLLDAVSWSDWKSLGESGGVLDEPVGRYFQVQVTLATENALQSPRLTRLTVEATPERRGDWTRNLRVIESHNDAIVRGSIPFEYEPFDHPRLAALRREFKLDDVVRDAKSELEILKRLAVWSSTRWDAGHLGEAYPAWDALEILKTHPDGRPIGGFCQQYNVLFLQACESFGFVGRAVSLNAGEHSAKIRSGHEVVEIWSNEYGKWIYIDGNTAWCALDEATRVPLSLWELRQRQLQTFSGQPASPVEIVRFSDNRHAWPGLASFPPFVELRLIPRSNFLAERSPLPLNQGMRGCFWTGHYAWTDAQAPAALLYGNRVHRRADWEWTLNQAHIVLEPTDRPGELRVHIDTVTPGFETFLADIDGQGPERVASGRVWKLRPGTNRLEARSRNIAGRDGSASWIVVEHVP